MDDQRFDALTRALARGSSRRTALKGLFLGVVGGVSLTMRQDRAGAQTECVDSSDCNPCQECIEGECSYPVSYPDGLCCGTEGNYYCSPECCSSDNCEPIYENQCGISICNGSGYCEGITTCVTGQRCCNSGTPEHYCGVCCADTECPGCSVCVNGTCSHPECCGDSDCTSICGECVEGTCVTRCTSVEYCCAFANDCRAPGECCTDDECPCGGSCIDGTCYPQPPCPEGQECCADTCVTSGTCECIVSGGHCDGEPPDCCEGLQCCGFNGGSTCQECCGDSDCDGNCEQCVEGECVTACNPDQECCGDQCVPLGQCAHLCIPESQTCSGSQLECCPGLTCCMDGDVSFCAECCADNDCGSCAYCSEGVCYGECSQSESCCHGQCVDDDTCCHSEGTTCGVLPSDDSAQLDCCNGLLCCDNLYYGASVCAECCVDADCDHGGWCHEGECKDPHACKDDKHCPKGACCCKDGSCSSKCCHHPHPPKPPKPAPSGDGVTSLPATGAGPNDERNTLLGAAALGAAAALYAAKQLRDDQEASEAHSAE